MLTSYDWFSARIHVFEGEPADVRRVVADRQRRMHELLARSAVFDQPGHALLVYSAGYVASCTHVFCLLRGRAGISWRVTRHHRDTARTLGNAMPPRSFTRSKAARSSLRNTASPETS